jgi:hypothetical protein
VRALEIPKKEELASHAPELRRRRLGRRQTAKEVGILGPEAPFEEEDHLMRRQSDVIRRHQRSSEVIRPDASRSKRRTICAIKRHSEALRGHSEVTPRSLRGHSEVTPRSLRGHSEVTPRSLRGNLRPSEALRGPHLLDGSEAKPFNRLALPRRQRGLKLDCARLEDAEGHRDETRVGLEPVPASFGMHPHAVRPVLNQGHLRREAITRNQTPSDAPSAPSARWTPSCSPRAP